MDDADRELLRTNRTFLVKNIHNIEDIVDGLFDKGVITEGMQQEIEAETTKNNKIRKMLEIVPRRGPTAFVKFLHTLVDSDNEIIADRLRPGFSGTTTCNPLVFHSEEEQEFIMPKDWPTDKLCLTSGFTVKKSEGPQMEQLWKNESEVYSMKNYPRGRVVIINNINFNKMKKNGKDLKLPTRLGSNKDEDGLRTLFELLNFEVDVHKDQKVDKMLKVLDEEKKMPIYERSCADCFVLVILTHGCKEGLYGFDSKTVSLQTITSCLDGQSWPQMKDKPKLLFIQACRGDIYDVGATGTDSNDGGNRPDTQAVTEKMSDLNVSEAVRVSTTAEENPTPTASAAHFLIAQATAQDMVSFRNVELGSWFIQAVVYVFRNCAHYMDINRMLTKVNDLVSKGRARDPVSNRTSVAASEVTNRLTKQFYFFPGLKEKNNVNIQQATD